MEHQMKKRILFIDDEEILTKTFKILLEKKGYDVYSAKNGRDAQIIAEEEPLDLIISDIRMPGISGVEAIRLIRLAEKEIPVIFITGFADDEIEKKAKELKPLAYLYKPFDCQMFLKVVEGAFN